MSLSPIQRYPSRSAFVSIWRIRFCLKTHVDSNEIFARRRIVAKELLANGRPAAMSRLPSVDSQSVRWGQCQGAAVTRRSDIGRWTRNELLTRGEGRPGHRPWRAGLDRWRERNWIKSSLSFSFHKSRRNVRNWSKTRGQWPFRSIGNNGYKSWFKSKSGHILSRDNVLFTTGT